MRPQAHVAFMIPSDTRVQHACPEQLQGSSEPDLKKKDLRGTVSPLVALRYKLTSLMCLEFHQRPVVQKRSLEELFHKTLYFNLRCTWWNVRVH